MKKRRKNFLNHFKKTEQIYEIERRMADQNEDGEWMEQRRKLITASNFDKIYIVQCHFNKNSFFK
jgi:hypothetical protein